MAKAKLGSITEKWINGKTKKQLNVKTEKQKDVSKKTKLTIYVSEDTVKSLWHNRAETRQPISHTIEQLVTKHLEKQQI